MHAEQLAESALAIESIKALATIPDLYILRELCEDRPLIKIKAGDGRVLMTGYGSPIQLSDGVIEKLSRTKLIERYGKQNADDHATYQTTELGRAYGSLLAAVERLLT